MPEQATNDASATPESGGGADWGFLPEGLQGLAEGHDKPESFWAEVNSLKGMLREREALTGIKPESLVDDEDWDKAMAALGKPASADGYKLPDAWQGEVDQAVAGKVNEIMGQDRQAFLEACHACDLTNRQAEALYGVVGGLMAENLQNAVNAEKPVEQTLAELWPDDTPRHLDVAKRGAQTAGLGDELDAAGLSRNPLVLKLAYALGQATAESQAPGSPGSGVLPGGEDARAEMYRLMSSDAYNRNDPATMRKVEALAARVKR